MVVLLVQLLFYLTSANSNSRNGGLITQPETQLISTEYYPTHYKVLGKYVSKLSKCATLSDFPQELQPVWNYDWPSRSD